MIKLDFTTKSNKLIKFSDVSLITSEVGRILPNKKWILPRTVVVTPIEEFELIGFEAKAFERLYAYWQYAGGKLYENSSLEGVSE